MNTLLQSFEWFNREERLLKRSETVLLAISGGLDSVVLAELFLQTGQAVEYAHCNFGLRGEESDRDEAFVRALAKRQGIRLHVNRFDTNAFADERKLSIQEAARILRYGWFLELQKERKLQAVCTAHHADDNVETMLMNLFRGTGIAGIRGILPRQDKIVRPLLFASRVELEAFALEHHLDHVEDSSNASDKYSRNYIRHQLLPVIRSLYPTADENLRQNMPRFREAEIIYKSTMERILRKLIVNKEEEVHIPVEKLRLMQPLQSILFEIFQPFDFTAAQLTSIHQLMDASTGSSIYSSSHRVLKNRNWFIISPLSSEPLSTVIVEEGDKEAITSDGSVEIERFSWTALETPDPNPLVAQLDLREVVFPLILRPWKPGDYFYPLGMRKKKKIARFLIDLKLPRHLKDRVLVAESGGRICWIVGHRIDDRFRVRTSTRNILRMEWHP